MKVDIEWKKKYSSKVATAESALKSVSPGNCIFIGTGCAEPHLLMGALSNRSLMLDDNEIVHVLMMGVAPSNEPMLRENFRYNSLFITKNVRETVAEGRADYTPISMSEIPGLFRAGRPRIDVALIQVTPPGEYGYCSLGISVDVVKAAVETADVVIAEVNPNMPRTMGDSFIHVDDIDLLVPSTESIIESQNPEPTEVSRSIAKHITHLIGDGSTLQMGIGNIPDSLLYSLKDKRDLGVHTEMFSDGVIDLIEEGVINNKRKTIHKGKSVTAFCMGSQRLYDFVNNNPSIEFYPSDYVNNPLIIMRNDRMVSINSALEVDVTGQVCAESLGYRFYSGIGGHIDFMRGAAMSRGGKPIIALPSTTTTKDGELRSRIVPSLMEGAGVVGTRADAHYVVTEHGMAYIRGRSIRERVIALISIAHPDFRDDLLEFAKKINYVYKDQPSLGRRGHIYPVEWETYMTTKDGARLFVRPIKPSDEDSLREMFYRFSKDTVYLRFFGFLKTMPHERVKEFVNVDYENDMAVCAVVLSEDNEEKEIVGTARYSVNHKTGMAEFAIVVTDTWHGAGIGKFLFSHLTNIAKSRGIRGFTAQILSKNARMLGIINKSGYKIYIQHDEDVCDATLIF